MKKIAIITSYTNHIRWDNYGQCDYCMYASQNHNEYCNKNNYSYIKEIVNNEDYDGWHPTWIKIDVLKKYLPLFDYVVWIDADAVFKNLETSIESFLEDGIDLVLPKLEFDKVGGQMWTHTTTGFMIWRNSDWSKEILNLLWDHPKNFKLDFFHEQSRLDEILHSKYELSGGENILNKEINDLDQPITLENVKILPFSLHKCFNDGEIPYVFHAGGSTPTKLSRLKEVLGQ